MNPTKPLAAATDVGEERRKERGGPALRPAWRARLDPVPRDFLADVVWPLSARQGLQHLCFQVSENHLGFTCDTCPMRPKPKR